MTPTPHQIKGFIEALIGTEPVGPDEERFNSPVAHAFLEGALPLGVPWATGSLYYLTQENPELCGVRTDLQQIRDLAAFLERSGTFIERWLEDVEAYRKKKGEK